MDWGRRPDTKQLPPNPRPPNTNISVRAEQLPAAFVLRGCRAADLRKLPGRVATPGAGPQGLGPGPGVCSLQMLAECAVLDVRGRGAGATGPALLACQLWLPGPAAHAGPRLPALPALPALAALPALPALLGRADAGRCRRRRGPHGGRERCDSRTGYIGAQLLAGSWLPWASAAPSSTALPLLPPRSLLLRKLMLTCAGEAECKDRRLKIRDESECCRWRSCRVCRSRLPSTSCFRQDRRSHADNPTTLRHG